MINFKKLFKRQLDIIDPKELAFPITIIGAGGIGSFVTLALAKIGCSQITVVDFDKVEEKNLPSQLYKRSQIGVYKTNALKETVADLTEVDITSVPLSWEEYYPTVHKNFDVIVCSVDSMDTRIKIWEQLIGDWESKHHFNCYIDARMGGELMKILAVNPWDYNSIEFYKKTLFPSSKAHQEPCTAKAIAYNTLICGGIVASIVKKYAKKEETRFDFTFDIKNLETV